MKARLSSRPWSGSTTGHSEADLIRIGRDIEAVVLARAVRWAAERRLFVSGSRTVVFR